MGVRLTAASFLQLPQRIVDGIATGLLPVWAAVSSLSSGVG